jgi:hypothetical protein
MLAAIRSDSVNFALLVHVIGAMILVGGLLTTATAVFVGWRGDIAALRLSYKTLVALVVPGWIVMRIGAEWVYSKQNLGDQPDQTWLGIGFVTADLGLLLLLLALILGGIGAWHARGGGGDALLKASGVIAALLLAAYVVAVWAMGAKPI